MKPCPYCAELIQDAAAKCRFCGEWLDPSKRPTPSVETPDVAGLDPIASAFPTESVEPPRLGVPMPRNLETAADGSAPSRRTQELGSRQPSRHHFEPSGRAREMIALADDVRHLEHPSPNAATDVTAEQRAWSAPAWLTHDPARQPAPPPHVAPLPNLDDPNAMTAGDHAALEEVAQRMERIKASAAVVRSALAEREAHRHGSVGAASDIPGAVASTGPSASGEQRADPPWPANRMPTHRASSVQGSPSPASENDAWGGPQSVPPIRPRTPATSRPRPVSDHEEWDVSTDEAGDDFASRFLDDEFDEQHGHDPTTGSMSGYGSMSMMASRRPIPWVPIVLGAFGIVVVGVVAVAQGWLDDPRADEPELSTVNTETPERDAQPPTDPTPAPVDPGATRPAEAGEGQPVQPEASPQPTTGTPSQPVAVADKAGPASRAPLQPEVGARIAEARALYDKQKLKQAAEILDDILSKNSNVADALLLRAQVELDQGKMDESLATASRCIELDPTLADCWLTLGVLRQNRAEKVDAVQAYEKYLALAPEGAYARDVKNQIKRLR